MMIKCPDCGGMYEFAPNGAHVCQSFQNTFDNVILKEHQKRSDDDDWEKIKRDFLKKYTKKGGRSGNNTYITASPKLILNYFEQVYKHYEAKDTNADQENARAIICKEEDQNM
jgi:hypothetical protein